MIDSKSSGGWSPRAGRSSKRRCCSFAAASILLLPAVRHSAAQMPVPLFKRDVVVLDPAHGGTDNGARISDSIQEKDVTLELATRLRSLLMARGFTVVSTRDTSGGAGLSPDQRAELANKSHAVACLVLHATASGNGVQISTSAIGSRLSAEPESTTRLPSGAVPWDRAQEIYVPQSLRLANRIGSALARSNLPLAIERVALRPLDNLMCPAISLEIAPQTISGGDATPVSDAIYQQRVADAVAAALVFWRNQAQPPEYLAVPRPAARSPEPGLSPLAAGAKGLGA